MIKDGKLVNPEVRIETTNHCNATCIMCPREKMTREKKTMPFHHFCYLVNQAKELGAEHISVFGYGEPMLDEGIAEKIRYCTDQGLYTFFTTNASLLDIEMASALLDAGLCHIRFSIHGLQTKTYEAVHRGLKMDETIRNINNFIAMNNIKKVKTLTDVIFMPMHNEDIEDIKARWLPHVHYLEIWEPHNWTDGRYYRDVKQQKKTCGRPFRGPIQINADGAMMVCCFDYDAKLTIGDTYKDSIEEILLGTALQIIQAAHRDGYLGNLICAQCDQLNEYKNSPLLYSNRDKSRAIGKTTAIKFNLEE